MRRWRIRVAGLGAGLGAGLAVMATASAAQAGGVIVCNRTAATSNETLYVATITVDIRWGPTNNTVGGQEGWIVVKPGRCSGVLPGRSPYVYIEGSKGGRWRSELFKGTYSGVRTFEPKTAWWCVTKQASKTWPNYRRKVDGVAACPTGSYKVNAEVLPVYEHVTFTMNIR